MWPFLEIVKSVAGFQVAPSISSYLRFPFQKKIPIAYQPEVS